MKAVIALIFLAAVASSYGGLLAASPLTAAAFPYPYAYTTGYSTLAGNYQLGFDTSLPGSAYASYPYAAAPTAYGYGVLKAL